MFNIFNITQSQKNFLLSLKNQIFVNKPFFTENTDINFIKNFITKNNKELNFECLIDNDAIAKMYSLLEKNNINQNNSYLSIYESGTYIIDKIFKKQVDDNTLVISTLYQHPSVNKNLVKVKNLTLIDILNFDVEKFENIVKTCKFKKIFLYIVGTIRCNGIYIQQYKFQLIINILKKYNIKYKLMIDAVHELIFCNRDYSIFDYVVYTAHSVIHEQNIGICISKTKLTNNTNIFYKIMLTLHYKGLLVVKKYLHQNILLQYQNYLINYFKQLLNDDRYKMIRLNQKNLVNHIFSLYATRIYLTQNQIKKLFNYNIIECQKHDHTYMFYIRLQYLLTTNKQNFFKAIEYLNTLLLNMPDLPTEIWTKPVKLIIKNKSKQADQEAYNILKNRI